MARTRVFDENGALYRQIERQPATRLIPLGNHAFVLQDNDVVRFTFTVSE